MNSTPLETAINMFPTLNAFSDAVGVPYQTVQQWRINGVPVKHCLAIERATNGKVTREILAPEIFAPAASK